jgi:hypothetical protein
MLDMRVYSRTGCFWSGIAGGYTGFAIDNIFVELGEGIILREGTSGRVRRCRSQNFCKLCGLARHVGHWSNTVRSMIRSANHIGLVVQVLLSTVLSIL